uniref:Phosphoribosylformylglycinamidine synthase n=1 Tax=Ditylenchus dipsaci TaxID=166011 RepID=A0A915EBM2_9BILA
MWEETSDNLQTMQLASKCVEQQANWRQTQNHIQYSANFDYQGAMNVLKNVFTEAPKIAILREEGSNGDREMAAAFMMAGFQAYDLTMQDILEASSHSKDLLKQFQGIAFVGGFSYGDVLGSAKGWAASIKFNQNVTQMFAEFRSNPKTFSLGVCNGCQLMTLLGFVGAEPSKEGWSEPNVFLDDNESGRFYSGFNTVRIEKSNSILLTGMQDAVLGVWCSHGEGKFVYKKPHVFDELLRNGCVSLRYCNNHGQPTMQYPDNPNGSQECVAGLCSLDGRHLALMPHPDRSFLSWQWPNYPWTNEEKSLNSPWMKLFLNAFEWCISQ